MNETGRQAIGMLLWLSAFAVTLCVPGLIILALGRGTMPGICAGMAFSACIAVLIWWGNKAA